MSTDGDGSPVNLEQQRKRAKDLRRAHGEGDAGAAARIVHHLPRALLQAALDGDEPRVRSALARDAAAARRSLHVAARHFKHLGTAALIEGHRGPPVPMSDRLGRQ